MKIRFVFSELVVGSGGQYIKRGHDIKQRILNLRYLPKWVFSFRKGHKWPFFTKTVMLASFFTYSQMKFVLNRSKHTANFVNTVPDSLIQDLLFDDTSLLINQNFFSVNIVWGTSFLKTQPCNDHSQTIHWLIEEGKKGLIFKVRQNR